MSSRISLLLVCRTFKQTSEFLIAHSTTTVDDGDVQGDEGFHRWQLDHEPDGDQQQCYHRG